MGLCHIRPFTGYITAAQQEPWLRIPPPGRDRYHCACLHAQCLVDPPDCETLQDAAERTLCAMLCAAPWSTVQISRPEEGHTGCATATCVTVASSLAASGRRACPHTTTLKSLCARRWVLEERLRVWAGRTFRKLVARYLGLPACASAAVAASAHAALGTWDLNTGSMMPFRCQCTGLSALSWALHLMPVPLSREQPVSSLVSAHVRRAQDGTSRHHVSP